MSERGKQILTGLAALWIGAAMFVYCVRFTSALYRSHASEFDAIFGRIGALFGAN